MVGSFETIYQGMFGWKPCQQEVHVTLYKDIIRSYGSVEGWKKRMNELRNMKNRLVVER